MFLNNKTFGVVAVFLCMALCNVRAQDLEYKMELGGMAGGCFYLGDANYTALYKNTGFAGGVVARYNLNPRMVIKANLAMGHISGNTNKNENKFPNEEEVSFARNLYDLGVQFEYNFFAYGNGANYKGTKRLTPYILGGFGFTFAPKPVDNVFTLNFPLGVGVKYKIANRLNVGVEFSMRFSLSDKLDVTEDTNLQLDDPYGIKSTGLKNKDSYSFTMIYLTYDLFPKLRKCNN